MQGAAEDGIQGVQAVIHGQKREVILPAPLAEPLLLGRCAAIFVWLACPDEAVQTAKHVGPRLAADSVAKGNRDGAGGAQCCRIAHRPQAAAAASGTGVFFQTVDADLKGCRTGDHGGLLSSKEAREAESPNERGASTAFEISQLTD